MSLLAPLLALTIAQVGPNPAGGAIQGVPDELRDRAARAEAPSQSPSNSRLAECLRLASGDAETALDEAQAWREETADPLELAQSAHCLGLALVNLQRFDEARRAFELASSEAPAEYYAYRARLSAMAGNAALADGKPNIAQPIFAAAVDEARAAGDSALVASLLTDVARNSVAMEDTAGADAALAEARTSDPRNAQVWLLSATLSRRLGRLGEAQRQIEQAATLNARSPEIGLEAGVIAALSGREDIARRSFQSVIDVAPDSAEAERARAYLEQLDP